MAWEIYEKDSRRSTSPAITISKLGRVSFNAAAADILAKASVSNVLLLWDKEALKVGVRVVPKKDARSYNVHYASKNSSAGFAAKTFLHYIEYDYAETKAYPCVWNEKESTFEVQLNSASFESKKSQRFPREKTEKRADTAAHAKATGAD